MSNKYGWSDMDGGTICSGTNIGSEYLLKHEIADRMNMMQDVINAAITLHSISEQASRSLASKEATIWGDIVDAKVVFESAVRALNPKTVEQLRIERDAAADAMVYIIDNCKDQSDLIAATEKHKQAKAAHLQAVGGEG